MSSDERLLIHTRKGTKRGGGKQNLIEIDSRWETASLPPHLRWRNDGENLGEFFHSVSSMCMPYRQCGLDIQVAPRDLLSYLIHRILRAPLCSYQVAIAVRLIVRLGQLSADANQSRQSRTG
jgi:hypothetical protein